MPQSVQVLSTAGRIVFIAGLVVVGGSALLPAADARPADRDAAQIELGRRLFFDAAVSRTGRIACADCHDPDHGFSNSRIRSQDEHGLSPRHSQPVTDLGTSGFHSDGEFDTLEEVVFARVGSPTEATLSEFRRRADRLDHIHSEKIPADVSLLGEAVVRSGATMGSYGAAGPAITPSSFSRAPSTGSDGGRISMRLQSALSPTTPVRSRLERDGRYEDGFRVAFGTRQVSTERIAKAMVAYMRSLKTGESPFDRFQAGDGAALSEQAQQGLALFTGKASCSSCHALDAPDGRPALTDGKFHNTGVAFRRVADAAKRNDPQLLRASPSTTLKNMRGDMDPGALRHSFRRDMTAHFKTPSLRDVARRAPYMHDGSLATLEEVVRYYDGGGTSNAHLDPEIAPLALDDSEVSALVAFLESLSADERTGLGGLPSHRPTGHKVRVVDTQGRGLPNLALTVHACGDRLAGTDAMPAPFRIETDGSGVAEYPFPASTHVKVTAQGFELGTGRLVPDYTASLTLTASPLDAVSVRVRRRAKDKQLPSELFAQPLNGIGAPDGERFVLRRKRTVGSTEALYAMDRPSNRAGRVVVILRGTKRGFGVFELDLDGGASQLIDLSVGRPTSKTTKRLADAIGRIGKSATAALNRNILELNQSEANDPK